MGAVATDINRTGHRFFPYSRRLSPDRGTNAVFPRFRKSAERKTSFCPRHRSGYSFFSR
ncbi:MAG: hypothetical protein LBR48_01830 [Dysgonamonadaceae bacterium]|nr:hypothetical protein [Dysgonamonadaceae bacterium]